MKFRVQQTLLLKFEQRASERYTVRRSSYVSVSDGFCRSPTNGQDSACGQAASAAQARPALLGHQPIILKIIRILEMQVQHEQDPGQGAPQEETGVHVLARRDTNL